MPAPPDARRPATVQAPLWALWQFGRPHTIIGTSLSVLGLFVLAVAAIQPRDPQLGNLLLTWLVCLAANVFIVGLNQLTDVDIDRINKPELPLASGALTPRQGQMLVFGALAVAVVGAAALGPSLLLLVLISAGIGTAYSVPPLRLKRFHFWAAACIFSVRGVAVNLLLFRHFSGAHSRSIPIPPHIWLLTAFVIGLSLVIAWFKDIPDMKGDDRFRIQTLSLRLGPQKVFWLGQALLAFCYLGVIAAGLSGMPGVNGPVLVASHAAALLYILWRSRGIDPGQPAAMTRHYRVVWRLFFLEYVLFPISATAVVQALM